MNRLLLTLAMVLATSLSGYGQPCFVSQLSGPFQTCAGGQSTHYLGSSSSSAIITGYTVTGGFVIASQTGTGPVSVTIQWNSGGMQTVTVFYDCPGNPGNSFSSFVNVVAVPVMNWVDRRIFGPDTVKAGESAGYIHCYEPGLGPTTAFTPMGYHVSGGGQVQGYGTALPPQGATFCPWVDSFSVKWCSPGLKDIVIDMYIHPGGCMDTFHKAVYVVPGDYPAPVFAPGYTGCDSVEITAPPGYLSYLWSDSTTGTTFTSYQPGTAWVEVTDSNACVYRDTFQLTLLNSAVLSFSPGDTADICGQDSIPLTANGPFSSYAWSTGDSTSFTTVSDTGVYSLVVVDTNGCTIEDSVTVLRMAPVPVSISPGNLPGICPGDTVSLFASPGYTDYLWSNGDTSMSTMVSDTGWTSVFVTDSNGCNATDVIWIPVLPGPALSIYSPGGYHLCAGDSVLLIASGGASSYQWSTGDSTPSIFVQDSGWVSVLVRDSLNCPSQDSVFISTSTPLPVSISPTNPMPICPGDTTLLTATPGFASYAWLQGGTGQTFPAADSGLHVVSAIDSNGCVSLDSVELLWHAVPPAQIFAITPTSICEGDSVELGAPGGYADYLWSHGDSFAITTVYDSGWYSLTAVLMNGCTTVSNNIYVTVNPIPTPTLILQGDTLYCFPMGQSYQWYLNGSFHASTTVNYYVPTVPGLYTVRMLDNGCSGLSDSAGVNVVVGIVPENQSPGLKLYPNPSRTGRFRVEWKGEAESVIVFDVNGRAVSRMEDPRSLAEGELPLQMPSRGVYFISLRMRGGQTYSRTLLFR